MAEKGGHNWYGRSGDDHPYPGKNISLALKEIILAGKRMTAEERKQSIIDATIRVVSRLNYDRATTALIAKEAGVNEALIYNHFKSKQELQVATIFQPFDQVHHMGLQLD